jgi:hypothetical protein
MILVEKLHQLTHLQMAVINYVLILIMFKTQYTKFKIFLKKTMWRLPIASLARLSTLTRLKTLSLEWCLGQYGKILIILCCFQS